MQCENSAEFATISRDRRGIVGVWPLSGTPERGQEGAGAPPAFQLGEHRSKSALLNAMLCFLIVNMIQLRSYNMIQLK